MNETALDNAIVPQVPKPTLIPTWAPGIDVRMTSGPYKGKVGYIVGWHVSPLPHDRQGGWEIFIPKIGESVITLPVNFERMKRLPRWRAIPELMPPFEPRPLRDPNDPDEIRAARRRELRRVNQKRVREMQRRQRDGGAA